MIALLRSIVAVFAGAFLAMVLVAISDGIVGHFFFPPGFDPDDKEQLKAAFSTTPDVAFVMLVSGWQIATFFGAFLSAWIAGRAPYFHAIIIGVIITLGTILNLFWMVPYHPQWVNAVAPTLPIPASFVAGFVFPRRPTRPALG